MRALIAKFTVVALLLVVVAVPAEAFAVYSPLGNVDCSGRAADSAICEQTAGDPLTGPEGIILKIARIVAIIAGLAAIIFIVLAGIRYITSAGEPAEVTKAKKTIIFALAGLVVIFLAQAIISFVIGRI